VRPVNATPLLYLFAAGACAAFLILQAHEVTAAGLLFEWALFFGPALLFAFAYPRYVFDPGAGRRRRIWVLALNGFSLDAVLIAFAHRPIYPPFPLTYYSESALFLTIALPIFTISAVCLLLKKLSDLASAAVVLEWIFVLSVSASLLTAQWESQPWGWDDVLCSLSLPLLAFAAGSLRYRRALAHSTALLAAATFVPRLYMVEFTPRGRMISNAWIAFNGSNHLFLAEECLSAVITILTVALLVFAAAVAVWRLLPQRWVVRESRVSEWTWPAVIVMALFIGVWFRSSVLPYRIPGEVQYMELPIIQILHVEKHGLQFHETCVSVYQMQKMVRITHDDRRLLNYRFQVMGADTYDVPAPLMQRVNELAHSPRLPRSLHDARNVPVRPWNADYWYACVERKDFVSYYSTKKGYTPPPPDFVMLFHDLQALQPRLEPEEKLRDVCLGFCYDPCAAMGWQMSANRYTEVPGHFVCH